MVQYQQHKIRQDFKLYHSRSYHNHVTLCNLKATIKPHAAAHGRE